MIVILFILFILLILGKGVRKGKKFKAPHYASAAATCDYITTRNIIPNTGNFSLIVAICI